MIEHEIISKYLSKLTKKNYSANNLNDDVFFDKKKKIVISVDTYNNGIHFFNFKKPDLVIKKIIRSSISDLICKGVKPKYYFVSMSADKKYLTKVILKKITKSLAEEQKKFNIHLSGGDITNSKNLSFTVTSLGFSDKIICRNKTRSGDDIYVSGNIGDSYVGLSILKEKIKKTDKFQKNYFIKKYYLPDLPIRLISILNKYCNSSIDISDGLFDDLLKLTNKQKTKFNVYLDKVPTSLNFNKIIKNKKLSKKNLIFHGDDYQVIFTAPKKFRKLIQLKAKKMNQKVSIIGEITNKSRKNLLISGGKILNLSNFKGYSHKF